MTASSRASGRATTPVTSQNITENSVKGTHGQDGTHAGPAGRSGSTKTIGVAVPVVPLSTPIQHLLWAQPCPRGTVRSDRQELQGSRGDDNTQVMR